MKGCQERSQNGLQNSNLSYSDSFKVFERVPPLQPSKLYSRNIELAMSLHHVEESSGRQTFPVSEGREMARRRKARRMVC